MIFTLFIVIILVSITVETLANPVFNETNLEASCIISSYSEVNSVVSSCTNIIAESFTVPAGKTLNLNLKQGTTLTFKGIVTFGYGIVWNGPLVKISGTELTVTGEAGSRLDGQGEHYWDGKGGAGKPKLLRINGADKSVFKGLRILNCPGGCVSVGGHNISISGFNIDVSAGDVNKLGHNTDGFDLSSVDDVSISNCVVKNQDDCVAINYGKNVHIRNLVCSGGHGLSLSVGMDKTNGQKNIVSNITIQDCTVQNSRNGIHIKTHSDAAWGGYIKDVTYKNIKMSGITNYGVNIEQNYINGGPSGDPVGNVPIKGLNFNHITGTMSGSANSMAVYILCGSNGCSNFNWNDVSLTGAGQNNQCNIQPTGFHC